MKNGHIKIGIAGFGTIGTGVVKILLEKGGLLKSRTERDAALNWRRLRTLI